jgi:hypothetical protein
MSHSSLPFARRIVALVSLASLFFVPPAIGAFVVDNLGGPITANEVDNFLATVNTLTPPTNNYGNAMSTHGTPPQGIRRLYEATGRVELLDQYLRFCDVALAHRNDLPAGEGRVMWEGTVAPVWPSHGPGETFPGYVGCESGQVAGNIAYAAYLILQRPALWNLPVPDGNPRGFGVTYRERALTYLTRVDETLNTFFTSWFFDPLTLRVRKPQDPRWATNAGNESCTAWNRQWLFVMPYLYSARCHDLLADNPSYLSNYKQIVNQFATWFVSTGTYYEFGGHSVVKWYYEVPPDTHIENQGHAQHDVIGLFECYDSGYTTVTPAQMKVFADTARYVVNLGATNAWATNVDGSGPVLSSLKSDFLFLARWHRPLFSMIAGSNLAANLLNGSEGCKNTGYILAMKQWLHDHPLIAPPSTPTNLTSTPNNGQITLHWESNDVATYAVKRATAPGGPFETIATGLEYLVFTDLGLTNGATYYYVVSAFNEIGESANSAPLAAVPQPLPYLIENIARGGTATAHAQRVPNETANHAFDGLTSTKWFTAAAGPSGWLQYDFGANQAWAIHRYELTSANDSPTRDPRNWTLLGSQNGTDWTVLDTRIAETFSARFQTKSYDIGNATAYRYYRLNILANAGATGIQLAELGLFAQVSTPPSAPANIIAAGGDETVSLSWPSVAGALSYRIKRAEGFGPFATIAHTSDSEYVDTNVINRRTYRYVVSALNPIAESIDSAIATAQPMPIKKLTGEIIGTPGSFGNHPARTKEAAFDGNFDTFFAAPIDNGAWLGLDLGAGTTLVLREVRFAPRSGFVSRMTGGVFQGANSADFSDAVTLFTIPEPPAAGVLTSRLFDNDMVYRYVRYMSADGGQANIAELEFWGVDPSAPSYARLALDGLRHAYDGESKAAAITVAPAGLLTQVTYNGNATPPTYPGSYEVVASATEPGYVGEATGTLVIAATATVRSSPTLNGLVDGSVHVLSPQNVTLNGSASISGDLLMPGMPRVILNGNPMLAGIRDGLGAETPVSHTVMLNGGAVLRYLARRVDPISLTTVPAPLSPVGSRHVTVNLPGQSIGDPGTLRNLTLNGSAGAVAVPPGVYGAFTANGSSRLILGVAGAVEPAIYHLQSLTLNGAGTVQVVGPVEITLGQGMTLNGFGSIGLADHPEWLVLRLAHGGLMLNGNASAFGHVLAPQGGVTLNGGTTLRGTVQCDRLLLNGNALLEQAGL